MRLLSNLHVKGKPAVLPDRAIRSQSHYFIYRPCIRSVDDRNVFMVRMTVLHIFSTQVPLPHQWVSRWWLQNHQNVTLLLSHAVARFFLSAEGQRSHHLSAITTQLKIEDEKFLFVRRVTTNYEEWPLRVNNICVGKCGTVSLGSERFYFRVVNSFL